MPPVSPYAPATPFLPDTVDENAVRRLCGDAVFAEADKLQREGHVLSPRWGEHGPEASVRGTWRRVDRVEIEIRAGRLFPSCTRDGNEFCRHVGALLLQSLRHPDSLATSGQPDADTDEMQGAASSPDGTDESPIAELTRILNANTTNNLRQLARRRGTRVAGSRKADIVQQLSSALAEPANIDTAIAGLSQAEWLALNATHLVSAEGPASESAIIEGMRVLGGPDAPPLRDPDTDLLDALLDAGLVALAQRYATGRYGYGSGGRVVPRVVAARLPVLDTIARPAGEPTTGRPSSDTPRLGIIETIQVIAQASLVDRIHRRPRTKQRDTYYNYMAPSGFIFDPAEMANQSNMPGHLPPDGLHLVPPRLLADADLARLAERTGQPPEAVDVVVRLLVTLEIAHTTSGVIGIHFDRLQQLLDAPPSERLARLANALLSIAGQTAIDLLFGPGGAIELRWHPVYAMWMGPLPSALASGARLVSRLVGRMPPDTPYDLASFINTIERLAPDAAPTLSSFRASMKNNRTYTMTVQNRRGKQESLALGPPEGWDRFVTAFVTALLTGPLTWLGFVEVSGQPQVLRVRPEAGVLVGRREEVDAAVQPGALIVQDDLTVLVPPANADVAIHGLLARAGKLVDALRMGLRYKLTPAGVQALFDAGMTGPEFTRLLEDRAGGALPAAVRDELDRWRQHYGTIRLYDEVTIIELNDDFLLTELTAATSLESAIVERFSSRLIAIDAARAEAVIAELAGRGYAPRVIEES